MDLKEEAILGDGVARHWHYRAKSEALDRVVGPPPATVLDVGAGGGFFSRHLLEHGAGQAVCVDPGYAEDTDTEHAGRPLLFRRAVPRTPSDLILMMDVLEHVDDDTALAADYIRSAQSGARVIVTVPAFAWMWSEHDDFLEHRRRYTLPGVQAVLRRAGLRVDGGRYLYELLLPLAAATRLPGKIARRLGSTPPPGSQMRTVGVLANTALPAACRLEALLPRNPVAGLTAMAWGTVP